MKATIWHNPKCGTSRKTLAILEESGVDLTIIEYLKDGFNKEKLRQLIKEADMTPQSILRVRGTMAEELGLTKAGISEDAILDAMVQHPILVERPIVQTQKGVRLCRPQEKVHEIL
ncbi:arsenate reductase (glutaredoxin) [Sphingorhabdus lutea]|uniref:Arsenate reductase n=1 Tax=Sphingorhabdus lutea TaxID=1913578 RepID=A0A1L3JFB5_9SPHN|nr:arsenate reductase (glutaredoxin) [Sphingorhabdus lutea]APG63827.1 arsenate reductase (glutaredoxin) [Sphingorhabdus lutea]